MAQTSFMDAYTYYNLGRQSGDLTNAPSVPKLSGPISLPLATNFFSCSQETAVTRDYFTRQITFPTSSAINNAPVLSMASPAGRPRALPSASRNPPTSSSGMPFGAPFVNGM